MRKTPGAKADKERRRTANMAGQTRHEALAKERTGEKNKGVHKTAGNTLKEATT